MATSTLYPLLDALVAAARTALPSVTVYDGPGVSDDPGDYLMIGVDDPDQPNPVLAATSTQTPATLGTARSRDEEGDITCAALSWNGDADQSAARAGCKAITDAVENLIRTVTFPALGVTGVKTLGFGTSFTLSQDQNASGAMALVVFSIHYKARI